MSEQRRLKDIRRAIGLPSNEALDQLEGLDWSRVNLMKRTCNDCGKDFNTEADVNAHLPCADKKALVPRSDDAPGTRKRYKCHVCDFVAVGVWKLYAHLSFHYDERTWKCNHCDINPFPIKSILFDHLRSQHYSRPCPDKSCPKIYTSMSRLLRHTVQAHGREVKECESCRKLGFNLTSHMKKCSSKH